MGRLRADQDAFGHEIYDHHCGKAGEEIIERSDGFIDCSMGPAAYFTEYADWRACDRRAIDKARGRVLDIGCGAGRHALYLQSKGLDVLGIDVSPLALKTCRLRGLMKTKLASITDANPRWGTFDTIVMFGNNFGLFGSPVRASALLRRFHNMTSPNARLIVQSLDPYQTDEPWHKRYQRQNRRRGRMAGQVRIRVRYRGWISPWFDYLLVSQAEMRRIVDGTGWQVRRFYDSPGPGYAAIIEKAKG
jgi:cyclopropane fatty-acyl-phospholipid synthase-like methyltransferase